jgi:uncharacterized protein YjbI with pentapeptide repeats
MHRIVFHECILRETDFSEADLTSAVFHLCDLDRAVFNQTVLEKTDFRTAFNFTIDPAINKMKKAKFSFSGLPGLLSAYDLDIEDPL